MAYFDFDGTITKIDTLVPFLIYTVGWAKFITRLPQITLIAILYSTKLISNEEAKDRLLFILIRGLNHDELEKKAKAFATFKLPKYIKPEIYNKLEYHHEHGHTIVLVSANLAIYLRYFAKMHKLDYVIATEIEFNGVKCTGHLATRNCYGIEKLNRIKNYCNENSVNYSYSYGYGNSKGDYELLSYVDEPNWIEGVDISPWENNNAKRE